MPIIKCTDCVMEQYSPCAGLITGFGGWMAGWYILMPWILRAVYGGYFGNIRVMLSEPI